MRLLIVGTLGGQLTIASKIAMDKAARFTLRGSAQCFPVAVEIRLPE